VVTGAPVLLSRDTGEVLDSEASHARDDAHGQRGSPAIRRDYPISKNADSESVGDLVEEGNAFEADVVTRVESAGSHDEKEVRTNRVPEAAQR